MKWAWYALTGAASAYWLFRRLQPGHERLLLHKSVVVITGASAGIGKAYAHAFARRGARVVLAARRADLLESECDEIAPYAADVLVVPTDVTDDIQLHTLVDTTLKRFGQIDVLVNNAGIEASGSLQSLSPDKIRRMVDTNLSSAMCLTSLCLPSMLARGTGRIVNVASVAGAVATPHYSSYSAAKHGLVALSDSLRREVEGTGVEVISVFPYWTYSEMVTPEIGQRLEGEGYRVDTPEHVAERTIEGLADGKHEIYLGGLPARTAVWLERHFPAVMSIGWRTVITPHFIENVMQEQE